MPGLPEHPSVRIGVLCAQEGLERRRKAAWQNGALPDQSPKAAPRVMKMRCDWIFKIQCKQIGQPPPEGGRASLRGCVGQPGGLSKLRPVVIEKVMKFTKALA